MLKNLLPFPVSPAGFLEFHFFSFVCNNFNSYLCDELYKVWPVIIINIIIINTVWEESQSEMHFNERRRLWNTKMFFGFCHSASMLRHQTLDINIELRWNVLIKPTERNNMHKNGSN